MQSHTNPQSLNRYSYVLNNPLRYTDPTGNRAYGDGEDADCGGNKQDPNRNPQPYTPRPKKHRDHAEDYGAHFYLTSACSGLEEPCNGGGGESTEGGGSSGDPYPPGELETSPVAPNIAGIPMDNWTVENAPNLGEPGINEPNRLITTGAGTNTENLDVAKQALNKLIGNSGNILGEADKGNGKILYELKDGTNILFNPSASYRSAFMPKIYINTGSVQTNLIFLYPK